MNDPDSDTPQKVPPSGPEQQIKPGWGMLAAGWALALLVLTLVFNGFLQDRQNPNRLSVLQGQTGALSLSANHSGQYFAEGKINGTTTTFLLDTGATTVAVPSSIASRAGLRGGDIIQIETAAGSTAGQKTHIRRLELGNFIFSDLAAVIIPAATDGTVLLGMNALGELEMTQQDGKLILQKPEV